MAKKSSHYYQFAYQAMPILFHSSSKDFITLLRRDGQKFLEFWWKRTGESGEVAENLPSDGLTYEIRDYPGGKQMVLVTLPEPQKAPEAYFLAMLTPPPKKHLLPWKNFSRVFALQRGKMVDGLVRTHFAELTPRGYQRVLREGAEPTLEKFYELVVDELS
jgi:hypothetical protein